MFGIVAAEAATNIVPVLIEVLKQLEHRVYDAAGLAVINGNSFEHLLSVGRGVELETASAHPQSVNHTRRTTHAVPAERNVDLGSIDIVHDGIIENYGTLHDRSRLTDMNLNDKSITFLGLGYLGLPSSFDPGKVWSVGGFVRLEDNCGRTRKS